MNTQNVSKVKSLNSVDIRNITICAMCIALTYVATAFINIRLPIAANGGLVHLGNVPLFVAAVIFGKKTGAVAGGVGMALFDLLSGWTSWAPFTFVIVAAMGYTVGLITEKRKKTGFIILAILVALIIKIAGYYVAEGIIYGNWIAPLTSIPGNIVQVVTGGIIALPIIKGLKSVIRNEF